MNGYLYVAQEQDTLYIKVGRSQDPSSRVARLGGQGSRSFDLKHHVVVGNPVVAEASLLAILSKRAPPEAGRRELFNLPLEEVIRVVDDIAALYPVAPERLDDDSPSQAVTISCKDAPLQLLLEKRVLFNGKKTLVKDLLAQAANHERRVLACLEKLGFTLTTTWKGHRWFRFCLPGESLLKRFPELAAVLPSRAELEICDVM